MIQYSTVMYSNINKCKTLHFHKLWPDHDYDSLVRLSVNTLLRYQFPRVIEFWTFIIRVENPKQHFFEDLGSLLDSIPCYLLSIRIEGISLLVPSSDEWKGKVFIYLLVSDAQNVLRILQIEYRAKFAWSQNVEELWSWPYCHCGPLVDVLHYKQHFWSFLE